MERGDNFQEGATWFSRLASALADRLDSGRVRRRLARRLLWAVSQDSLEQTLSALSAGADPNVSCEDSGADLPLHKAAKHASLAVCKALLDAGARVDQSSGWGRRALQYALEHGALKPGERTEGKVRLLLERGAHPDALDQQELAPLGMALCCRDSGLTKALLEHGANPNALMGETERVKPLASAANDDKLDHAKLLVAAGADVEEALNEAKKDNQTWGWLRSWSEEAQLRAQLGEPAPSARRRGNAL
jgi:ankyrin repeat protein